MLQRITTSNHERCCIASAGGTTRSGYLQLLLRQHNGRNCLLHPGGIAISREFVFRFLMRQALHRQIGSPFCTVSHLYWKAALLLLFFYTLYSNSLFRKRSSDLVPPVKCNWSCGGGREATVLPLGASVCLGRLVGRKVLLQMQCVRTI